MSRKTIYVKPEKEGLYEKAIQLSKKESLSALLEEAVERLVQEKEGYYRWILLVAVLDRTCSLQPILLQELLPELGRFLKESLPELWKRANLALDVLKYKGLFDEEKCLWKGSCTGYSVEDGIEGRLWWRGIREDMSWLDEIFEIVTGSEYHTYEQEYKNDLHQKIIKTMSKENYELAIKILQNQK